MLERMIVKHWIALTVGFTLLGVLIRVRYNTQGHFAIGGEWLVPEFMLFIEWLIRMMRGVLIDAGIIRGHKKRCRGTRVQHDRREVYRTGSVMVEEPATALPVERRQSRCTECAKHGLMQRARKVHLQAWKMQKNVLTKIKGTAYLIPTETRYIRYQQILGLPATMW